MAIDKGAAPGSFWLTGSQPFKLMELAQESLAGRIAIIHMPSLSQHEIYGNDKTEPFSIDLDKLMRNEDSLKLNSIVYILVLETIIKEYKTKEINIEQKQKAIDVYKKIEEKKAAENKKYHMYQY